jgi:hypothetical protein
VGHFRRTEGALGENSSDSIGQRIEPERRNAKEALRDQSRTYSVLRHAGSTCAHTGVNVPHSVQNPSYSSFQACWCHRSARRATNSIPARPQTASPRTLPIGLNTHRCRVRRKRQRPRSNAPIESAPDRIFRSLPEAHPPGHFRLSHSVYRS